MLKFSIILPLLMAIKVIVHAQPTGWSIQSSPTSHNLYGIASSDPNTWIAVGDGGTILRSIDGGVTWSVIPSPVTDALRSVSLLDNIGLAVGITGRVIRTIDGGLNWDEIPRPTHKNLYAVSISNFIDVATGEEGTILVSLDNGLTWMPHTAGTASILFGVSVNDTTAVSVGGQGAIVFSIDGGNGWGLTVLGDQLTFFYSTSFVNSATGWAVGSSSTSGNIIIHSTDYGFEWTSQTAPTTEQLFGVSFASINSGCAVGATGTIIHTSDGGTTWMSQASGTTQTINAVSFADTQTGIAVGDGGTILRTITGGMVSIKDITDQPSFTLYPNPSADFVILNGNCTNCKDLEMEIFNSSGELVRREKVNSNRQKINVRNLDNGIYIVTVKSESVNEFQRLIISR